MKKWVLLFIILLASLVAAHQPRIVFDNYIDIFNPEVSQAFYGNLEGESAHYQIRSDYPFNLYINILVPDLEGISKDVSVEVTKDDEVILSLDGLKHEWTPMYEEHAGDNYFDGPTDNINVEAGIYHVEVFSPDNEGKYVLVVGQKEEFPFNEIVNMVVTLPELKKFFGKSPFTAFFNLIGLYIFVILAFILLILGLFVWYIWRHGKP